MDCLAVLHENPNLEHVPDEQLTWLFERSECRDYPENTIIYRPGDPIDHFHILLDGRISYYLVQGGQQVELGVWEKGSLHGVLPFSRLKDSFSYWQTLESVTVLALHRKWFREMVQTQYELTEALVHQMTSRVRDSTRQMQQNEKMMSLGKLSAGLAHELNNPVAAVVRSAETLRNHLHLTPDRFKDVMLLRLEPAQVDAVNKILFDRLESGKTTRRLTLLERTEREDELLDWLEDNQVDDAGDLTAVLVEHGFERDHLEAIGQHVEAAGLSAVLNWVVNLLVTETIVGDIQGASQRIARLIDSIKSYTHMDRGAGKECVHLRDGIDSTLTLLNHKLKAKHIQTEVVIPDDLPPIEVFASELNQVWTNLLDNAIDTMSDGGKLRITAEIDRQFVLVRIEDNGGGIPADIQGRIFDPFFTTKAVGQGTGLGLDIVQGIISHHQGKIYVDSEPGRTEFRVCLPM